MADSLKALGKYGSEKPDEAKTVAVGNEGYTTAGSTLFYAGKYYTQIVSTQDDPKFAAFALELAKRVAARQKPGGSPRHRRRPRVAASAGLTTGPAGRESAAKAPAGPSPPPSQAGRRRSPRDLLRLPAGRRQAGRPQVCCPGCFRL